MSDPSSAFKVLLVDDHPLVRAGLRSLIDGIQGFTVAWEAEDVSGALALFCRHQPDLVVLDVRLPDGDGLDCLRRMIHSHPGARVVMLSANAYPPDVRRAVENGARAYITKTISRGDLEATLRLVAAGRTFFPPPAKLQMHSPLTPRELEVLICLRRGLYNPDIASALRMSEHTVRTHVKAILAKLDAADRTEAVGRAFDLGYLRPEQG